MGTVPCPHGDRRMTTGYDKAWLDYIGYGPHSRPRCRYPARQGHALGIPSCNFLSENPSCRVFGQTRTTDHHEELHRVGIKPIIKGMELTNHFPFVIFCAPPSGSADYPAEVRLVII
eukprot:Gb_05614 [translate_table: standard]